MSKKGRPIIPRFYVHPKSKDESRPVIMTAYSSKLQPNGRFQYSTAIYVENWETRKGKKGQVTDLTDMLKDLQDAFKKATNEEDVYDVETLKAKMDFIRYGIPEKQEKKIESVIEFAEDYLKSDPMYSSTKGGDKPMTEQTLRTKWQTVRTLKAFQDHKGYEITFQNFDALLWEQFRRYMKEKGFSDSYRGKNVKDVKSFFNRVKTMHRNVPINEDYKIRGVAPITKSEKKFDLYLDESEIQAIAHLDLAEDQVLANARDWLIILCGLGLRIGDALKLTKDNIIQKDYGRVIRVQTQKTGELVIIPTNIFPWFTEMMERRGWKFPKPARIIDLNDDFRKVAEKAKIYRKVSARVRRKQRFSVVKDVPLYEAVSSHIGRRSFVSNLIHIDSLKASQIMSLTGHLRAEMIEAYNQLDKEKIAEQIARKFPNSNLKVAT